MHGVWAGGRGVADGASTHGEEEATVHVHVRDGFPSRDGFHNSQPESFSSSLDCGAFPVDAVFSRSAMPLLVGPRHLLCVYSVLTY